MPARRWTLRSVAISGILGVAVAGALASGCSGDDASSDSGASSDTGADQTDATQGDASRADTSQPDASQPDTSQPDTTQPDTSLPDTIQPDSSQPDASRDATQNDAQQDVVGMDTATPDGSEAGGDGATPGDASDASDGGAGACVTSAAQLAGTDGGAADAGFAPTLLFGFDNPGGLGLAWSGFTDSGSNALLGEMLTDGYPCPGALEVSVTYSAFGPKTQVLYNFTNSVGTQDWTGRTRLHVWIKVVTSDYSTIAGVEPSIINNGYSANARFGLFLSGTTLSGVGSHNGWHETFVDLTPSAADAATIDFVPSIVNELKFELQTQGVQVDGGPVGPPPATLLVDSIWLE